MELSVTGDGYIKCVAKEEEHIISEQITAINASNLSLPCMRDRYESNVLYYHVADNISLFDYIRSKVMDFDLLKEIATNLGNVFIKLDEVGLQNSKIITDIRYIFISPNTKQLKVIQCPIEEYNECTSYQKIMTSLCYNIKSQNAYVAIGYILEAVKQESFNIHVFTQRLSMLENPRPKQAEKQRTIEPQIVERTVVVRKTSYILCGIIAAIMEAIGIILLPYIFVESTDMSFVVLSVVSSAIVIATTMIIFVIMKLTSKSSETQHIQPAYNQVQENISMANQHVSRELARDEIARSSNLQSNSGNLANMSTEGGTTILVEEVEINPMKRQEAYSKNALPLAYLVEEETNRKHQITRNNFLVGRATECDLPVNSTIVSKKHAEIVYENGIYYVRDLKSSNFTYLNKATIEPNELYRIDDGSRIGFGNKWFIFKTNQ